MTLSELKTAFYFTYNINAEAIYFSGEQTNVISEFSHDNVGNLDFGIYLLTSTNNENRIKLWSLNEPEPISINIDNLFTHLHDSWIKNLVNAFEDFVKSGGYVSNGCNVMIWGNLQYGNSILREKLLNSITNHAITKQYNCK